MNFFTQRRRGFTFIELIVAVALSIILIRGMFTMFHSATRLTALSDERMQVLLESSAVYEYLATDLTRAVTGEGFYFQAAADGSSIIFRAMPLATEHDVFIKYEWNSTDKKLRRFVYAPDGTGNAPSGTAVDDDGDGKTHDDEEMVVGMNIVGILNDDGSVDEVFEYHIYKEDDEYEGSINADDGSINEACWTTGTVRSGVDDAVAPKAVKFVINFLNPIADPNAVAGTGLPEEEYTMIIPVMPQ
jgi:prepilin-type N-terminal cleavage/methylation domain-containing protein